MIRLIDCIAIRTTPARVFEWLASMPDEYMRWHPDHVSCRVIEGSMLSPGSAIECKEYLHGRLHTLILRTRGLLPNERLEYTIKGLGTGAFSVVEEADGVEFCAEVGLGTDLPVAGPLVDLILRALFGGRIEALRVHMREEGENLKRILEEPG